MPGRRSCQSGLSLRAYPKFPTATVATRFRQRRHIMAKVQAVLAALTRMGFVNTADGGKDVRIA